MSRNFIKYCFVFFLKLFNFWFSLFRIKKDCIIFSSSNDSPFNDNSRYLFEEFSKRKLKVFWKTENNKIKKYLQINNLNYISFSNIFKISYIVLKTKIVFSSGSDYFDCFGFLKSKNIIKIHLGHGVGNKVVIQKYIGTNNYENYDKFDYINFTSNFTIKKIGLENYKLNKNKFINFGYPRIENLTKNSKNQVLPSTILGNYDYKKIILYTPTWRPYKYNFPLLGLKNFDLKKFNNFLKKNNIIFFISFHPLGPKDIYKFENLKLSNLKLINKKMYPTYDTTYFLKFADILLNDCSTTSTEFCVLGKPQIFTFPDYNKYIKYTTFLENYKSDLPGNLISNFADLKKEIIKNIKNKNLYKKKFHKEIKRNLKKYYDHKLDKKVNYKFYFFVKKLLN